MCIRDRLSARNRIDGDRGLAGFEEVDWRYLSDLVICSEFYRGWHRGVEILSEGGGWFQRQGKRRDVER